MAESRSGSPIKLTIQLTHILSAQEARSRTQDCSGLLATQPALPYQQILHEGDQRMYQGHRQSKLVHFHNTGSNLRILADEIGTRITTPNSLHHSKQRTVSLDHFTYGTTRMPRELAKADWTSSSRITEHPHLHWWSADPYRHSRETPRGSGASTHELAPTPPQNQLG